MWKFTIDQLYDEVKRLSDTYPTFQYRCPKTSLTCDNLYGGDCRFPKMKGCIIGQSIRNLGGKIKLKDRKTTVEQLAHLLGGSPMDENGRPGVKLRILKEVQRQQDAGHGWSEAWKKALRINKLSVDSEA